MWYSSLNFLSACIRQIAYPNSCIGKGKSAYDFVWLVILRGNLFGYKGAIFENLVADIFTKKRRKLCYFCKDSGLEVDFVIRYEGECTLIEVKASSGNVKSTKTILAHPEKYHVHHAIKLGDVNIGQSGQMTILPLYMAFLLDKT